MNVTPFSYSRAFGDGPPWSSDVDDTRAGTPSPNNHTNGRTFELSTIPTRRVFSGTGLVTRPATIRYLDHSAIAATPSSVIALVLFYIEKYQAAR
ncbi:hypothetical protein TNCV_315321 [Trichonephila clavipes]|nr:hypothetical protein TNCV_315321 [Trichonephila clavipes]